MIIPTLVQLESDIRSDLEQAFGIDNIEDKRYLNAIAAVQAAKIKQLYISIAKVQKNLFPDTADSELSGGTLERAGRIKIERNPFPATQGVYDITVTGVIGGVVSRGLTFRTSNNFIYQVLADVTLASTTAIVSVISLTAGRESLLTSGQELIATSPIVNVENEAIVSAVTTEPQDAESLDQYRAFVLQAYRTEPQGGSAADYRIWVSDAQGVTRIYPYVGSQAGIINIYVEADTADKIPSQSVLDDVLAVINFDPDTTKPLNERGRRPLSAWVINILPVVTLEVDINITNLSDDSAPVLAAIKSNIETYLETIRPFVAGADDPNLVRDTLRRSELTRIVLQSITSSNLFDDITLTVNNNVVDSFRFLNQNIPLINEVTAS